MGLTAMPNHPSAANGGIASRLQSARLVAAVAELGSLGRPVVKSNEASVRPDLVGRVFCNLPGQRKSTNKG